jgi:hypothetical protein
MENIAIKISYKGSGLYGIDKKLIDELEMNLRKHYITHVKQNEGPQSGNVVDVVVDIIFNTSLENISDFIKGGLIWDILKKGTSSYILKPLFKAFSKLEHEYSYWDYLSVRFLFDDTTVIIYGVFEMFTRKVSKILPLLFKNYDLFNDKDIGRPNLVIVPMKRVEQEGSQLKFALPEPTQDYTEEEYLEYWGLSYTCGSVKKIFNVRVQKVMDEGWDDCYQTL